VEANITRAAVNNFVRTTQGMAPLRLEVDDADDLPRAVETAFTVAMSDRPGPVVVSLPEDMLRDVASARPGPRVEAVERALVCRGARVGSAAPFHFNRLRA